MTERMQITLDGKPLQVSANTSVAAAVLGKGEATFRRSVSAEPRGPLCGMGVCFECRLTIDGQPHQRSCQLLCKDGMAVRTDGGRRPSPSLGDGTTRAAIRTEQFDVLIVGAGPAGMAAAWAAAQSDVRVGVVDDNPDAGGQIWRSEGDNKSNESAAHWFERIREAKFEFMPGTQIVAQPEPNSLLADSNGVARLLRYQTLILATGARERFLPFPGWTLPGVMGAGGLQALVKSGMPIEEKRIVIAGSGPLLLAVADYLKNRGTLVTLIAEQTPFSKLARFGFSLLFSQRNKLRQGLSLRRALRGIPFRTGCWPIRAEGDSHIRSVTLTDGRKTWREECDYLACGFGLVPNLELSALLGCRIDNGVVSVDQWQRTTVGEQPASDIFCAGEPTGIGGLDKALIEGQIAGYISVDREKEARLLLSARAKAKRFVRQLARAYALRDELRSLAEPETIVCRCEDVSFGKLKNCSGWREAKLQTRCGMGPCQGRICGPAVEYLFGWNVTSARPPVFPVELGVLANV